MKQHRETRMDRGDWSDLERPEYLLLEHGHLVAYPGTIISPKQGETWVCLEGHVIVLGQTGGWWCSVGNSRQTMIDQRDGWWSAYGNSGQTVINRQGGVYAYEKSRQHRFKPKE